MTGLEEIITQIEAEAKALVAEQLQDVQKRADAQVQAAKEAAAAQAGTIRTEAEEQAERIRERAASAAQLEKRNQLLVFKQNYMDALIKQTREALENAEAEPYFEMLVQMAKRFAMPKDGEIRLNSRDLARLPEDFSDRLKAATGVNLQVSQVPAAIGGGFLLEYGGVDINCSLAAIFDDQMERLRDRAGALLFTQGA